MLGIAINDCFAQAPNSDANVKAGKPNRYFTLSPALMWVSWKDDINSALTYRTTGFRPAIELGLAGRSGKTCGYTSFFYGWQHLQTEWTGFNNDAPEQYLTMQINTSRSYQVRLLAGNRIRYRLGYLGNFEYNHQINDRLSNSSYTYAIWAQAGIANRLEWPVQVDAGTKLWFIPFEKDFHFLISWQINVPVIGCITRPNFAGIRHFANGEFSSNLLNEMEDHLRFTAWHNFLMLQSNLELQIPVGNHNRLRFNYLWEGFRYDESYHQVQGVRGILLAGMMFRLDSRTTHN